MLWASTSSWFGFSCNPPSFVHAISNNTLATFVAITQGLCSNTRMPVTSGFFPPPPQEEKYA